MEAENGFFKNLVVLSIISGLKGKKGEKRENG
jgi:hypothetical protein